MAPSQLLPPRDDIFDSPATALPETREAPGTTDSLGDTTWAVVAIVLGAFLMVTLVIFSVLYYLRWRQLARAAAAAAAAATSSPGGESAGSEQSWGAAAAADAQLRHHRSRLRLDPAAVGSLAAAAAAAGPKRLRKMTSEDQAEAHELERSLMIRKSLASRESWGSNASHNTLVLNNHNRSVSGSSNTTTTTTNNNNNTTSEIDGRETPTSRYRSQDSLKSWEAGVDVPRRNSRVVLPAVSAESLRGHPALEAAAAPGSRTPPVPPAPAGLQRKLMSPLPPLPPLPNAHTR